MIKTPCLLDLAHLFAQRGTGRFAQAYGGDLRPRQLKILRTLQAADGVNQTDLVKSTGIDRSTMGVIMRRLVKLRLVMRRRSRTDVRAYVLSITPEGSVALAEADRILIAVEQSMLDELPGSQRAAFVSALEQLAGLKSRDL